MSDSAPPNAAGPADALTLRPEQAADEPLLFQIYASTREAELALTGWDERTRRAFLEMQFRAMRRGYESAYPAGEFSIICRGGQAVGRLVINRAVGELRVVDLALLPAHRRAGLGTRLVQQVCAEAARAGKPVRLSVLKSNRALHWYARLGFVRVDDAGPYVEMEWRAPSKTEVT